MGKDYLSKQICRYLGGNLHKSAMNSWQSAGLRQGTNTQPSSRVMVEEVLHLTGHNSGHENKPIHTQIKNEEEE